MIDSMVHMVSLEVEGRAPLAEKLSRITFVVQIQALELAASVSLWKQCSR